MRTLEGLPLNTFSASTIAQALEVLSSHPHAVIFCDEHVSDGSYRNMLALVLAARRLNRFIVVMRTDEWKEYLEALRLGVAEVLRIPLQAPDIDIAFFHAVRDERANQAIAAQA